MKYDIKDKINKLNGFYEWNKNHHLIDKDDERYEDYKKFKKENGFYPDECWNLYSSVCLFIIPRLKYFKEHTSSYPVTISSKEWKNILDKMIWSFEESLKDDAVIPEKYYKNCKKNMTMDEEREAYKKASKLYYNDIDEGLNLFAEYFHALWW